MQGPRDRRPRAAAHPPRARAHRGRRAGAGRPHRAVPGTGGDGDGRERDEIPPLGSPSERDLDRGDRREGRDSARPAAGRELLGLRGRARTRPGDGRRDRGRGRGAAAGRRAARSGSSARGDGHGDRGTPRGHRGRRGADVALPSLALRRCVRPRKGRRLRPLPLRRARAWRVRDLAPARRAGHLRPGSRRPGQGLPGHGRRPRGRGLGVRPAAELPPDPCAPRRRDPRLRPGCAVGPRRGDGSRARRRGRRHRRDPDGPCGEVRAPYESPRMHRRGHRGLGARLRTDPDRYRGQPPSVLRGRTTVGPGSQAAEGSDAPGQAARPGRPHPGHQRHPVPGQERHYERERGVPVRGPRSRIVQLGRRSTRPGCAGRCRGWRRRHSSPSLRAGPEEHRGPPAEGQGRRSGRDRGEGSAGPGRPTKRDADGRGRTVRASAHRVRRCRGPQRGSSAGIGSVALRPVARQVRRRGRDPARVRRAGFWPRARGGRLAGRGGRVAAGSGAAGSDVYIFHNESLRES